MVTVRKIRLHVELEVHYIAILHDVIFAFLAKLASIAAALFAAQRNIVFIRSSFRFDEAALKIGMDNASGLGSLRANGNGPGARFGFAAGEIALRPSSL